MMNRKQIATLAREFKRVFQDCYFEYASEIGYKEKGTKLTGKEVNPVISDKIKVGK